MPTSDFNGFLVGMAIGGLGFGMYMAVDLALVVDVLPDPDCSAKDPGVLNIAGTLPSSIAPAIAPAILAVGGGSYAALYGVAGVCAIIAAVAICRSSASDGQVHRRPAGRGLRRCQGEAQAGGQECRVPWRTMTWEVSWLARCSTPSSTGRPAGAAW